MPKNDFSAGKRVLFGHDFCRKFFNFLKNLKEKMTVPNEILGFLLMVFLPNVAKLWHFLNNLMPKNDFSEGKRGLFDHDFFYKNYPYFEEFYGKNECPPRECGIFLMLFLPNFAKFWNFLNNLTAKNDCPAGKRGFFL